jgi:hypothetical protein
MAPQPMMPIFRTLSMIVYLPLFENEDMQL